MRVIARSTLAEFWLKHRDAEQPLRAWLEEVRRARWQSPADVTAMYRTASVLRGGRIVFNIAGNKYRLIVAFAFPNNTCFIKFIGTHVDYDAIDATTVEHRPGRGI